jgi:hypothetical protein
MDGIRRISVKEATGCNRLRSLIVAEGVHRDRRREDERKQEESKGHPDASSQNASNHKRKEKLAHDQNSLD